MRFPILPENEMKKGKWLIPNENKCTITICNIDEDIVLPSAKKVKKHRDEKDTTTDNEIQTSEIEQTLDTCCQTDKAFSQIIEWRREVLIYIFLAFNGNTIPIRTQSTSGVGTFIPMSCKQDFTTA